MHGQLSPNLSCVFIYQNLSTRSANQDRLRPLGDLNARGPASAFVLQLVAVADVYGALQQQAQLNKLGFGWVSRAGIYAEPACLMRNK